MINLYPNGQVMEVGIEDEKGRQGLWLFYNENGTISREANYKNDLLNGEFKRYNSNGSIAYYFKAVDGNGIGNGFESYENGMLREEFFIENGEHRPINFWDEQGVQLMKDGTGIKIEYIGPGSLQKLEQHYENGIFVKEVKLHDVRSGKFKPD